MSKGEATRTHVLRHATERAAVVGLEGLSIGVLARELEMSKSGLFAHFKSKSALQVQVLEFAAERFSEHVVRPTLRSPRGLPRMRSLVEHWFQWFDSQGSSGCIFVAAVTELDDRPGPARDHLVDQQRDWLDVITAVAQTAVTEGHFRADLDPAVFARELYGVALVLHLCGRLLDEPEARTDAEARAEALIHRSLAHP